MDNKNIVIKLTKHAKIKIKERNISLNIIKKIISNPEMIENDKIDESLVHLIGKLDGRYLRIIGRRDIDILLIPKGRGFWYQRQLRTKSV